MENNTSTFSQQYSETGFQISDSSNPKKSSPVQNIPFQIYTPFISPTVYQFPNLMYQQQLQYQNSNSLRQQQGENQLVQHVAVYPYTQLYNSFPTVIPAGNITPAGYQLCMFQTNISQPVQNSCVNYQGHIDFQNQQKIVENSDTLIKDKCKNEYNASTAVKIEGSQTTELPISSTLSIQIQNLEPQSKNCEQNNYFKSYFEEGLQASDMNISEKQTKHQTLNNSHHDRKNDINTQEKQCQYKDNVSKQQQNIINDQQTIFESSKRIKKIKSSKIQLNLPDKSQNNRVKRLKSNKYMSKKENSNNFSQQLLLNQEQKESNSKHNIEHLYYNKIQDQVNSDILQKENIFQISHKNLNSQKIESHSIQFDITQNQESYKNQKQNNSIQKEKTNLQSNIESNHEISIDFDDIQSVNIDEDYQKFKQKEGANINNNIQEYLPNQLITRNKKIQKSRKSSKVSSSNQNQLIVLKAINKNKKEIQFQQDLIQEQNQPQKNKGELNLNTNQLQINKKATKKQLDTDNIQKPIIQQQINNSIHHNNEQNYSDENENDNKENSDQSSSINEYMKKGNCVKNIIKAFQNWCKDGIEDDIVISQCPQYVEEGLSADQIRKKLNRYTKKKVPNHQNLQRLVEHDKFSHIFLYFLKEPALDWISSSYIKNKDQHIQFIKLITEKWDNQVFFDGFMKVLKRKKNLITNKHLLKDKHYCQEALE